MATRRRNELPQVLHLLLKIPVMQLGATSGSTRVLRGGSWGYDNSNGRVGCRDNDDPYDRYTNVGFRCAQGF